MEIRLDGNHHESVALEERDLINVKHCSQVAWSNYTPCRYRDSVHQAPPHDHVVQVVQHHRNAVHSACL